MESNEIYTEIRKLRKKLRQIENLEKAQRPLNPEERAKIQTKHSLRSHLQEKLKFYEEGDFHKPQPTYTHEDQTPDREEVEELVESWRTPESDDCAATELESPPEELPIESSGNIERAEDPAEIQSNPKSESTGVQKRTEPGRNPEKTRPPQTRGGSGDQEASKTKQSKGKKTTLAATSAGGDAPREVNLWDKVKFTVTELVGHNDIICSIDCSRDTVVSGSRDTSIKIWDAGSGVELRSFGGHTDSVTGVLMVPIEDCQKLASSYNQEEATSFIISSSLDCSLKLWALGSGDLLKSTYTFNAITCLGYIRGRHLAVVAYTGGKVELWDILKGESSYSVIGHDEAVTSLKVTGEKIVTASGDGVIKLWELRGNSLHPIFVSENVKPAAPRMKVITRKVHTAVEKNGKIYYGDDGHNVKVLDWRGGVVNKLRNHKDGNDFGLVDSILVASNSDYLVCSGYDIDLGNGYLNFFSLDGEKYRATLTDDDISRVFTLADCTASDGHTRLVTGGAELKVWDVTTSKSAKRGKTVTAFYNQEFTRRARDSEEESEDDSSDGEDDRGRRRSEEGEDKSDEKQGYTWWCDII